MSLRERGGVVGFHRVPCHLGEPCFPGRGKRRHPGQAREAEDRPAQGGRRGGGGRGRTEATPQDRLTPRAVPGDQLDLPISPSGGAARQPERVLVYADSDSPRSLILRARGVKVALGAPIETVRALYRGDGALRDLLRGAAQV